MLDFSTLDNESIVISPSPNGGLYTGERFAGPWGNVPVIPDTMHMTTNTLKSSNPPAAALVQFGNNLRPGNNEMHMEKYMAERVNKETNIYCTNNTATVKAPLMKCKSFDTWAPQHATL